MHNASSEAVKQPKEFGCFATFFSNAKPSCFHGDPDCLRSKGIFAGTDTPFECVPECVCACVRAGFPRLRGQGRDRHVTGSLKTPDDVDRGLMSDSTAGSHQLVY